MSINGWIDFFNMKYTYALEHYTAINRNEVPIDGCKILFAKWTKPGNGDDFIT